MTDERVVLSIYLDANIIIHIVEGHPQHHAVLADPLSAIDAGQVRAATCELSLAEALVGPTQDARIKVPAGIRLVHLADLPALLPPHKPPTP